MRFLGSLVAGLKAAFRAALATTWVLVDEFGKAVWRAVTRQDAAQQIDIQAMLLDEPAPAPQMAEAERVQAWARSRVAGRNERLPDGVSPQALSWMMRLGPTELQRVASVSQSSVAHHLAGNIGASGLLVQSLSTAAVDAVIAASKRKPARPREIDMAALEARVLAARGGRYRSRGDYGDEPEHDTAPAPAMAFS